MRLEYEAPQGHVVSRSVADTRNDPAFASLAGEYRRDFGLAALAEACKEGTAQEADLDDGITALRGRLKDIHPVVPLLLNEVQVEDPERQLPLVFKWGAPSVKTLNDKLLGRGLTDEFFRRVRLLVADHFGAVGECLPVLSILNFDFKGGKAILNLNSPVLDQTNPRADFQKRAGIFQEALDALLAVYLEQKGIGPAGVPKSYMVFEASDWTLAEDPKNLKTSDYVEGLLLAEHVVNMTKRRLRGSPAKPNGHRVRADSTWRGPREYAEHLKKDLTRAIGAFSNLVDSKTTEAKYPNSGWGKILTRLPIQDIPFLTPRALQAIRNGTFMQDFPFVSREDSGVLAHFVEVVNTIDVLKPFLHRSVDVFYGRVEKVATILQEEPQDLEEKKNYFMKLMEEAANSIKNIDSTELVGTRLGLAARIYQTLCLAPSEETPSTLLLGDVVAFGPINLAALYVDALNFLKMETYSPEVLRTLLLSAGDAATEYLRNGDTVLATVYNGGSVRPYIDGSGGDEITALVDISHPGPSLDQRNDLLMQELPVRLTSIRISGRDVSNLEIAADLLAAVSLTAEEVFAVLKEAGGSGAIPMSFCA